MAQQLLPFELLGKAVWRASPAPLVLKASDLIRSAELVNRVRSSGTRQSACWSCRTQVRPPQEEKGGAVLCMDRLLLLSGGKAHLDDFQGLQ